MAICCVGLGVGWMSSRAHSSSLGSANEELRSELGAVRTELMSVRVSGQARSLPAVAAAHVCVCAAMCHSSNTAHRAHRHATAIVSVFFLCVQGKMASKIAEFQHLQANYDLMQQRLMDTTTASQRKDAELQIKEQALQQKDRDVSVWLVARGAGWRGVGGRAVVPSAAGGVAKHAERPRATSAVAAVQRAAYEDTIKVREGAFMKMLEDLQKQ